ncbi:hypothetical protein HMPREF1144_0913 [Klebsiella sp. OBRC7]|nr:hypothetical protein HMPREF1144_0913 [Klebsiella sp. OBRC7]
MLARKMLPSGNKMRKCCGVRHKMKYFHFIFFLLKTIVFS